MTFSYIIVQAGGKGTRLKELTTNKPKGIVPVENEPMIFHLFRKYPKKKFILIGDYLFDVLDKYLQCFANVEFMCVKAEGTGTCGGIGQALKLIPDNERFLLIWSDLVVGKELEVPSSENNQIGLPVDFECRWKYEDELFSEQRSIDFGVAGFFVFKNKNEISDVPQSGEFVRYLQEKKMKFEPIRLHGVKEVGTMLAYESTKKDYVCRPFNKIEVLNDKVIKYPITSQGEEIARKESYWYKEITKLGYKDIPKVYSLSPLTIEKICGNNPFKKDYSLEDKEIIVENYVNALKRLHDLGSDYVDYFSLKENYITKTFNRINKIRDLVPFANEKEMVINGIKCKNIFFIKNEFSSMVEQTLFDTTFSVIHGDCTFSNVLVNENLETILIDPRGYFGKQSIFGDIYYDWAKLYYSISGNYDSFNNKRFKLIIKEDRVDLSIESMGYEQLVGLFLNLTNANKEKLDLLHSIIWLSLSTYAWEDYDSICGAFYNGVYLLNKFMEDYGK